ncbi:MAG: hypothetical protein JWO31_3802, partial [Phycisphaerales bacterium]|nr:hypothetical protein [Phycisphaerales bacterium]
DADARLAAAPPGAVTATSDGIVLDRVPAWFNLTAAVCRTIPSARVIDLSAR